MPLSFRKKLAEGVVLFDGAMGTMLYKKGAYLNQCYEGLNLSAPKMVLDIHKDYVQAGCDVLEFRRRHPRLGILGGLDKRALAAGRREIDREVARAARMAERGRYVPGFDHLIPPDVPWENFRYAAAELRKVCFGEFGA